MPESPLLATTGELAGLLGAALDGPADLRIGGVDSIDAAGPEDLTFIRSSKYAPAWAKSRAGAALVTRGVEVPGHDPSRRALLYVDDADEAMLKLLEAARERVAPPPPPPGVHPTAVVEEGVSIPAAASVGAMAVIGRGSIIGEGVVIGPHCCIAPGVRIGEATVLHARVTLLAGTTIGRRCEVFPGVVVGGDGFGYLPGPNGPVKIPHLGGVRIGDEVELGSGTMIDRGKFSDTVIGDATKIDNLVQIGHGCRIGRGVIICGCCGVGGSVRIGDGAIIGGHVAVTDNIEIAAGARVGGGSALDQSVTADEPWFGFPARPASVSMRAIATSWKLPEIRRTVRTLEKRVGRLESGDA